MTGPRLIPCGAEPRHSKMYAYFTNDYYGPTCPDCAYVALRERHDPCRHSHHRRYRRSKWFWWLSNRFYALGITAGGCTTWDAHCRGCRTNRWRGKRPYVLGWPRERWACLLRYHHWPTDETVAFGLCGKCVPWTCCGSTNWEHKPGCAEAGAVA